MDIVETNGQNAVAQGSRTLNDMPEEILEIVRMQQSPTFLDRLSAAALIPRLTLNIFIRFPTLFADTSARWLGNGSESKQQNLEVIAAFASVLPLAPSLSIFLQKYLRTTSLGARTYGINCLSENGLGLLGTLSRSGLQRIMLATFRLLNFDLQTYSSCVSGTTIQSLFQHADRAVRYLAVRIFCQLTTAADFTLESMVETHVGRLEAVMGDYDGRASDYEFLSLWEQDRLQEAQDSQASGDNENEFSNIKLETLSPLVARYSRVLLPRPNGLPNRPSTMVLTATTAKNMEAMAESLLGSSPILLHGLAGSGKTSLVNDFARELGVDSRMVTLHLNEQTDAKMLIGMYATGSKPGSFTWRAGVLTTAVREGRWVFIEDLDRAPNEVISVILPLIERGELLIPSRGEVIKAGPGFKLLASMRTSLSVSGQESPPALHMLGTRLWHRVHVQMPSQDEFREIIAGTNPILHKYLPGIIAVYERLYALSHKPSFASKSRTSLGRPISPRDLLKWCRRLESVLTSTGSKTGTEPISEATQYDMFLEATDCFASNLQTDDARRTIIACIAEEMHIDPQRVDHFMTSHVPRYEDLERQLIIGRARLSKRSSGRITKPTKKSRPFANTTHAKRLLEQVGVAIQMSEPVLLVGETGIGKTTVVQQLADSLGYKLTAVNLSQQSEVGDLLGGFKPVNVRSLAIPLKEEFDDLFASTGISTTKNQKYLEQLGKCVAKSQWNKASRLWREAPKMFESIVATLSKKESINGHDGTEQPTKRRKTESKLQSILKLKPRWDKFSQNLDQFDIQLSGGSKGFAFTFVEGNIVKAARNGDWVLLDEINLASPDTLESIADLLHSGSGNSPSILLSETGEIERIRAHPDFRIFGAMNPATDVGKRDLPMGLRTRFTEIYVESPDKDLNDLMAVIKAYIKGSSSNDERAASDVARLYMNTKRLADEKRLVDGANQVPHYSLRTLTRVLSYVNEISPLYGLRRALYEGFAMGFLTMLNRESEKLLVPLINHHLLESHGNPQALLSQTPRHPEDGYEYVRFINKNKDRQYWMLRGSEALVEQPHYIITPFVERNMLNLVRATSTRRFPVLVQGPTSSGKTSMIEYLAKFSGNKFVRINNHEHTDLQEYLGTYISTSDGQLRFQEGLLVQALRQGHWIVLDELNLAPTDVLEALNRLLDDNRELLIPETQEIVRPHPHFMLFATQNPPGLYGGRKTLSRAFRNRFLELHFDDIPENELDFILEKRSQKVAPSDCRRIVSVYKELSRLRQSSRLFEQKDSFATLRDLFRWALRDADNREQLAANGYMLLAERVRNPDERQAVKEIIEKVFKSKIDEALLYSAQLSSEIKAYDETANTQGVVWTSAMRRLYVLVSQALRNNEPVLLVGETGCGKTTVCQMLADAFKKDLNIINAHQNTETGDLIGAQRPVRNRAAVLEQLQQDLVELLNGLGSPVLDSGDIAALIDAYRSLPSSDLAKMPQAFLKRIDSNQIKAKALFEWSDGSLVQAMKEGQFFLLDEISLADDSVLERLNSVLESQRSILLAEKGVEDSFVQAADGFQFFATMNPGGDYGKRELSPALRNRFTEIWVPSLSEHDDVLHIVEAKLDAKYKQFGQCVVRFSEWFGRTYRSSSSTSVSVRDVLAWVAFINSSAFTNPYVTVMHGAAMVFIDTMGANPAALLAITPDSIREERIKCLQKLGEFLDHDVTEIYFRPVNLVNESQSFTMGDFTMTKDSTHSLDSGFAFNAPTTKLNGMRVIRALQVRKPILIEGNPGVGKTTLIAALARACGKPLTRINLSEQTDLMDLFGSDVPVEGAEVGHFAWRDAPFLQAMQKGEWVLLDEMNLASQSVLEGLNACLDHRGEVYVSELDQTFRRHPNFAIFAAQNPHHQGGGRKGLPSSFVNRFTVVYADVFSNDDLELICRHNFPTLPQELMMNIICFVSNLEQEIARKPTFGSQGGPWEFNLRDILRWLQMLTSHAPLLTAGTPSDFLDLIFRLRFRTSRDRDEVKRLFAQVFGHEAPFRHLFHNISSEGYQVGMAYLLRDRNVQRQKFPALDLNNRLAEIESIISCIQHNLPCILVGPSGSGKTTLLQHVAATSGKSLVVFPLNADIDTMDLVGGFEQVDPQRAASRFLEQLSALLKERVLSSLPGEIPNKAIELLELLSVPREISAECFMQLSSLLLALEQETSLSEFAKLAQKCEKFASQPMSLENARFEWVDGVLIRALEEGKWLVLDNANLCSASVLDRLNSLLEPNGFLIINEHCGPDGKPKIVKPHPDFRIFLTMDSRFGELSRAMRNRAIEIFLEPLPQSTNAKCQVWARAESAMQRYQTLSRAQKMAFSSLDETQRLNHVALSNLAWSDIPLLTRYASAFQSPEPSVIALEFGIMCRTYVQLHEGEANQSFREAMGNLFNSVAAQFGLSAGFRDAQILHPFQNSPLVPLLESLSPSQIYSLGSSFDLRMEIYAAIHAYRDQGKNLQTLKPSGMNRLQRSLVRASVSAVSKDSTVAAANFLQEALESIGAFEKDGSKAGVHWKVQQRILSALLQYWWDTYHLVTSSKFEEATFQAHLAIGEDMFKRLIEESHSCNANFMVLFEVQKSLHGAFTSGFKLTTGLSMERLWKHLRPATVSRLETLNLLTEMQELANRFDKLRWNTLISISELGAIFLSFVKAYHLILTSGVDGVSLVKTLGIELEKVESSMSNNDGCHFKPFFVEQFEALRQTKTLKLMQNHRGSEEMLDLDTLILSDHSTMFEMRLSSSTTTSQQLKSVEYLLGAGNELQATMHTLSSGFLLRLNKVEGVNLRSLKLLESELPLLGQKIASSTDSLAQSQFVDLNSTLLDLIAEIRRAHDYTESDIRVSHIPDLQQLHEDASIKYQDVVKSPHETANAFHNVNKNYFQLSVMAASEQQPLNATQYSAYAWINFAIGALTLYVPDKAFDPDKRQRLERGRHLDKRENLFQKLAALRRFEQLFTGQDSNLRCQLLETEIEELGEPQDVLQEIYRPEVSELHHLQGEFNSLLKSIVQSDQAMRIVRQLASGDFGFSQEISLIQSNIRQVIRRLSERFKGYGDITDPVVSMLRCLQLGLLMAASLSFTSSTTTESSTALSGFTPFLGGDPAKISEDAISDHPIEYLGWLSTVSTIEDIKFIDDSQRQRLLKTFHVCFEEWIKKLESDRQEAESKSGLYRFRGSEEDEEEVNQEELNQLFPEYNAEDSDREIAAPTLYDARDSAVKLAKLHSTIFIGHEMPSDSIKSLVKKVAIKVGTLHNNSRSSQSVAAGDLLPGSLLLLDDRVESLKPTATVSESYNFYADANLPECRNLVALIHQIQARFCELQNVDEIGHMQTLEDVLVSCRELLLLKHTEPLAKIIVKVEKIHAFMHEWQFGGWASKIYTAPALYDRITATIVSWRRLELSTWAKLFDMESEKCEDDARSWWFVAYQVIVAAPLAISESADQMHIYAQKLLKDLESYFNTAIMGQFAQRLQLLKQFQHHLEILALDAPNMAIINAALTNFIALFARYQVPVKEHLKKGRISLEKAMRDILLLASWKDTNIVALRDSAKRSHHKLFKVVRKFRSLLGQPMEIIIKSGLPDQKTPDSEDDLIHAPAHFPSVDLNALALCASSVPKWSEKSKRFISVSKTISMMADSTEIADSAVNVSNYLDSFIGNVITSTEELQKATPSTMTEDNKDTVKHLKNRKRKLFADTLKELRQMGIKHNLGADALAQQDSLALILARIEPLLRVKDFDFDHLEYYFHKAIDLAPRAREVVRQHSEDLSSAEILRSTGFLEGLLQVVLNQQVLLSKGVASIQKLDRTIKMSGALWAPTQYHIKATQTLSNHAKQLRWLPNILNVASDLIEIHGRLGKIDNDEIGKSISGWVNTFKDLDASWSSLPQLPFDLTTTQVEELERRTSDSLSQLMIEISQMSEVRPDLTFILNQISLWTKTSNIESPGSTNEHSITDLDAKLSTVCDTVLVAIEKYKKSIIDLPSSTEEANWLVRHDLVLVAAIKSLHCEDVVQRIEETFEILRNINLDDEKTSEVSSALFAVALPIFQQYFNTLRDAVIRYAALNRATCKVLYILSKIFIQIATQGFCTPSEKSNAQDGQTEKLEGGTGLGDGEGAEDISKDIQDDENLDELAQEPNEKSKDEIEDEKDAVDMADGEMEGEMGEAEENGEDEEGSGDEESGDEMDEEAGDVDDLDPNAVDEKMWDGDKDEAEKDQEGDDSKGQKRQDEQVAAQDSKEEVNEGDDGEEEEDDAMGAEQGEEVTQQDEAEKHDPHAEEGETLDLPEDMELDGDEKDEKDDETDDGVNDMSDIEDAKDDEEVKTDGKEEPDEDSMDPQETQQLDDEMDVVDLDEDQNEEGQDTEQAGDKPEETEDDEQEPDELEGLLQNRNDEANPDAENAVPSDLQGIGEDQDEQADQDKTDTTSKAQRDDGGKGGDSSEQKDAAAEDGEKGRQANGDAPQDASEETQDSNAAQPFKKLGDALESWHRQQTKIREAAEEKEKGTDQNMNMDTDTSEFQHLQDEEAEADTQAMGTATEEQAHALDESMAIDEESSHKPDQFQPDEIENPQEDVMDFDDPSTPQEQDPSSAYEGQAGATINQAKQDRQEDLDERRAVAREDFEEDVEEVDNQLESTHLDSAGTLSLRSAVEAREQWTHYEALTRDLSLSLTEQLRLILAPTLATKMRGDFRTGKRLNIKRIIPYIASQYKRDKIWMRRSVPSKRSYQIMLAVDDSKSMGESGSGSLAFETLVMVSKSLSMLEVGEICVVGFGENVKVAHEFDAPFSSDAGPKVFQNFGFEQKRTDVTKLVRESIELFRTARTKASSSPADLWQVELIISDGVCDSSEHEPIRRLLREALEERIMMVFVIVDDLKNKKKGESVMDLQEAKFVKNEMTGASEVKIERYLDTFPFQYYLVVSDVKELPGVLATLLRQWFAEVVDSGS